MRGREKQPNGSRVRVSDSSDGHISYEDEDDDFQPQPSRKKKATTAEKGNTKSFYGGKEISTYNGNYLLIIV